jgi:RNA polymerase sigma factor (sigma-70 family)
MRPRLSLLELFSTFALLEGDRIQQWVADPRLRRSVQANLPSDKAQAPDRQTPDRQSPDRQSPDRQTPDRQAPEDEPVSEAAFSLFWYKRWQDACSSGDKPQQDSQSRPPQRPLAELHLAAYLQESCYWTARKTLQRFSNLSYGLADYFQLISAETERVLKYFNPSFGNSLKGYASVVHTSLLKDYLRQVRAIDVCSDWSLLRKVSHKRLHEVLSHAGIAVSEAEQYHFAWVCFKTICLPGQPTDQTFEGKGDPEQPETWSAIAQLYNTKRGQQLSAASPPLTPEQIQQRLAKVSRWIRQYLYPTVDSLNKTRPGQEKGEIQDDLADGGAESLLDQAIDREADADRRQQQGQLHQTLVQALTQMDPAAQDLLRLSYQENLSQQALAARLQMNQSTVSRRLKKAEENLLTKLLDQRPDSAHKLPEPSELKQISLLLREWLENHYADCRDSPAPSSSTSDPSVSARR